MKKKTESPSHFVYFPLDVNFWAERLPETATARPSCCPSCNHPGQTADGRVVLHGHGVRVRKLRGPRRADGEPDEFEVPVRRYACQACGAIITVGPRGLLPRRRYTAQAIALALWLWAVWLKPDPEVRRATSPIADHGVSRPERWPTLRRWGRAAGLGGLWSSSPAVESGWSLRRCAERIALWLGSLGDPETPATHRVFDAAAHAR